MTSPHAAAPLPDAAAAAILCQGALGQIQFAHDYIAELLQHTPQDRWFTIPAGAKSHVAWQVGHLAVSQYGLLMFRQRGRHEADLELIPGRFRKTFGRGSVAAPPREDDPTPEALLDRLHQVHRQSVLELTDANPHRLLDPVEMPYAVYPVKLGAVMFCPLHQQIHAGQIGMLRRLLGLEPIR